jgi:hypothetical protein
MTTKKNIPFITQLPANCMEEEKVLNNLKISFYPRNINRLLCLPITEEIFLRTNIKEK